MDIVLTPVDKLAIMSLQLSCDHCVGIVIRLSFPPRTHEHCSQEMLKVTGNLDINLSKSVCLIKALHFANELCLIKSIS
jgi:hypothetical protein